MTVRELVNVIGFKIDEDQYRKAQQKTSDFVGNIKKLFAALAIYEIGKAILDAAAAEEKLNAEFSVLLNSAEKATDFLQTLEDMEGKGVVLISKDAMAEASKEMIKFGMTAEQIPASLTMLGNIAGTSQQKLISLSSSFARVIEEGQLTQRTMMSIRGEGGFDVLGEMARTSGKSIPQLQEMLRKGQISAEMVYNAFRSATTEGGKFFGMTEKLTNTFTGQSHLIKMAFGNLLETIGTPLLTIATKIMKFISDILTDPKIKSYLTMLVTQVGKVLDAVFSAAKKLLPVIMKVMDAIIPFIEPLINALLPLFDPLVEIINTIINLLLTVTKPVMDALFPLIELLLKMLVPVLAFVQLLIEGIGMSLKTWLFPLRIFFDMLKIIFDFFNKAFSPIFGKMGGGFKIIENAVKVISTIIDKLLSVIEGKLIEVLKILFQILGRFLQPIIEKITETLSKVGEFLTNIGKDLLNNIIGAINWLLEMLNKVIDTINRVLPGGGKIKKIEPINIKDILNTVVQGNKTTTTNNIKLEASFNFQDPMSPTTQKTVASNFQFQLKRILLSTAT